MILTLKGDTQITNLNTLEERRKDENKIIKKLIEKSIEKWANYYNILIYLFVAFNAIGIAIWVYFRMPLYYRLDTIIYMQENKINDKKKLNFYDKIKIALMKSIWERDHISSLIFEFIISLIGAILKRGEIIYPFMLLAILDLNMDLHNIIISIKTKYKELGLTFVLMILIMYVFSNVAFFFFNEDFKAELDYFEDNYCESLIFCFLTTTDSGLRARIHDLCAIFPEVLRVKNFCCPEDNARVIHGIGVKAVFYIVQELDCLRSCKCISYPKSRHRS
jgi:hypothetical protein